MQQIGFERFRSEHLSKPAARFAPQEVELEEPISSRDEALRTQGLKTKDLPLSTSSSPSDPLVSELTRTLSSQLPSYMVPSWIHVVPNLPLLPSGKVDRSLIKSWTVDGGFPAQSLSSEESTLLEHSICSVFSEILGIEPVSVTGNFFALGGNSLSAAALLQKVARLHEVELPLPVLMESSTPRSLAQEIRRRGPVPGSSTNDQESAALKMVPDLQARHEPFPLTDIQQAYLVGRGQAFELGNVATHA